MVRSTESIDDQTRGDVSAGNISTNIKDGDNDSGHTNGINKEGSSVISDDVSNIVLPSDRTPDLALTQSNLTHSSIPPLDLETLYSSPIYSNTLGLLLKRAFIFLLSPFKSSSMNFHHTSIVFIFIFFYA